MTIEELNAAKKYKQTMAINTCVDINQFDHQK